MGCIIKGAWHDPQQYPPIVFKQTIIFLPKAESEHFGWDLNEKWPYLQVLTKFIS